MSETAEKLNELPEVLAAFQAYEHFCKVMLDAYVIVDKTGRVVKSNQLFAQLVGQKPKQILKANSFDELLTLEINKVPLSISELLKNSVPTRIDEVRGKNHQRDDLNFIIGIYPFANNGEALGAFIMIRDVTAETNLQDKYKDTAIKSITDPLTGLFTRGYFEDYLNLQMKTLKSMPSDADRMKISIALLDIDFFKKVNDVHGHQAGDHVLKIVSGIVKKVFRKTDIACRYGGEEFLVILPSADLGGAILAVDKLRQAVEAEVIEFNKTKIPVTISCGVAEIIISEEEYTNTIARADAALYESKRTGRNRVSLHDGKAIKPAATLINLAS